MKSIIFLIRGAFAAMAGASLCIGLANANEAASGSASFVLQASSDSTETMTRTYSVNRYLDDSCTKYQRNPRILRKKYANSTHQFDSISISGNEPFFFQVDYFEKRRETERACSASIGFSPEPGRSYKASYEVSGQVSRCRIKLMDVTNGEQEVESTTAPETMCTRKGATGNSNGVPTHNYTN